MATVRLPGDDEPPPKGAGERWNRGKEWNGIGCWADAKTAEEVSHRADSYALQTPDLVITDALALMCDQGYADKRLFTYLDGKGNEVEVQSFAEVLTCARRIGAYLQREMGCKPGDRAVLLYPPGQEFILAFIGCVYAGIVAVPVYPPHPYRLETDLPRLNLIVKNSGCKVALTDSQYMLVIRGIAVKNMLSRVGLAKSATWPNLRNVQTDKIRRSYAHIDLQSPPNRTGSDLAFLQYTSGSTSAPKGVMVTNNNLRCQLRVITMSAVKVFGWTNNHTVVSWLPQYHDMGLIGIFLTCIASGVHLVYMTPISFLQDPTMWLSTVNKYQGTVTCAPNFAFALAQRKTSEALRDSYDLSCLKVVICGAEPIRTEVMSSFHSFFSPSKYNPKALMPAYGLAEFTLCATRQPSGRHLNVLWVNQQVLGAEGKVVCVPQDTPAAACYVGVGEPFEEDGTVVKIVDPDSRDDQGEGRVGEIWLDGPSKARGYFDDEEKTAAAFRGMIKGQETSGHIYLQTGDQGFLYNGELFITGRIKDLIIVRGRNLYPQDIEFCVETALEDLLRPGCSGSFAHDLKGEETVAYVAELRAATKEDELLRDAADKIRRVIAEQFQVAVSVVVLVEPRSIPKTTSGKIQRHKCKIGYHEKSLRACYTWEASAHKDSKVDPAAVLGISDDVMSEASFVSANWEDGNMPTSIHYSSPARSSPGKSADMSPVHDPLSLTSPVSTCNGHAGASLAGQSSATSPVRYRFSPDELEVPSPTAYRMDELPEEHNETIDDTSGPNPLEREYIEKLVSYVVEARELPRETIDIDQPMSLFGFDSAGFVALGKAMAEWVGKEVSPAIIYKYTTIREVAGFLSRGADDSELSLGDGGDALEPDLEAPIAIVGIGLKTPGGPGQNIIGREAFWEFMTGAKDGVREDMPGDRKEDLGNVKLPGAYINGIDAFDAAFFGVSPAEASHMDYHQTQALETVWHSLEDAGIDPSSLSGRTVGVYVGAIGHEFAVLESLRGEPSTFAATGISNSLIANRISYILNVRGPSLTIDTACSSSLVAVNDAVRDLRFGHCGLALAGGVNLILSSAASTALYKAGFLSSACRTFDAKGDGYCRGEGSGMVVLKRLSRALAEGDRVYAIIRGIAVNHDGRTASLTAPNPLAQEAVLRAAYRDAKVDPSEVRYIEAHGTGTKLGDSIEMTALGSVVGAKREGKCKCLISSSKSNIGHLEAAAGVIGLIRCALVLHHGSVPKMVHFETPNPLIPWDRLPFTIPTSNVPLQPADQEVDPGTTIFAGVSSFGFGGTNAHAVLESVPKTFDFDDGFDAALPAASSTGGLLPLLLPISARSEMALRKLAEAYGELLTNYNRKGQALSYDRALEACIEAGTRRTHLHGYRIAATGRSATELKASMTEQLSEGAYLPVAKVAQPPEVVFLFTGQGAGYPGMGKQLYVKNAVFRASINECEKLFQPLLEGASILKDVIEASDGKALSRTCISQPALFAIEYAMTRVWAMLGVEPSAVLGHSVGEVVAAVVAGCMSLSDGAQLICARGKAMDSLPSGEGGMTVVFAEEALVRELASSHSLEMAAINGQTCINVAGSLTNLSKLEAELKQRDVRYKRLEVANAFHSSAMEPALPAIRAAVAGLKSLKAPKAGGPRLISLITGQEVTSVPDAEHWANNVRQPVLFLQGMELLSDSRPRVFIEMGPDAALTAMARKVINPADTHLAIIPSMTRARRDDENLRLTEAFGRAYVAGVVLKWSALKLGPPTAPTIELPLYPFDDNVYVSLADLTTVALAKAHGKVSAAPSARAGAQEIVQDYGKTLLFEESWLLRSEFRGARRRILPPAHTLYICSDPIDAAALVSIKELHTRSHAILVPQDVESAAKSAVADANLRQRIKGVDMLAGGDILKQELAGPVDADSIAVIYIASGEAGGSLPGVEDMSRLTDADFGETAQLLCLLRAMAELQMGRRGRLWIVTCRAKRVTPEDRLQSMGTSLWSAMKSAMQESYPGMWGCMIDLPGPGKGQPSMLPSSMGSVTSELKLAVPAASRLLSLLDHETSAYGPNDPPDQLAYRRGRWLTMKLREAELASEISASDIKAVEGLPREEPFPCPGVDAEIRKTLSQDGFYLLTGGLGGLGLHCAFALARHGAVKLILTSRGGRVTDQYKKDFDNLCKLPGLEVHAVGCDTGSREAVFKLFDTYKSQGGIRGVVHCAGILADGNLRLQDVDKLGAVWGGKVDGAVNLHLASLRQVRPLDLWLTYSSSSALVGSPGQANYAAANAALDSIAILRRQAGLVGTSFQWGVWVGVGFAEPSFLEKLDQSGFPSIIKNVGNLILTALLNRSAMDMPRNICCHPVNWARFVLHGPAYMMSCDLECFEAVKNRTVPKSEPAPLTEDMKAYGAVEEPNARLSLIEEAIISGVRKATGKSVTSQSNLAEIGIASLEAVELMESLMRRYPVNMQLSKLLEYSSVEGLSRYLTTLLDRVVDAKRTIPLSRAQDLLLATNQARSFLFQEIRIPGPLAIQAMLTAWRQLLARHAILRTVLDVKPGTTSSRQQVFTLDDTPISQMFSTVSRAAKAKDLNSLETLLNHAADSMATSPATRLIHIRLATPVAAISSDSVVLLAVPRLLVDGWSLRLLTAELRVLYDYQSFCCPGAHLNIPLAAPAMSYFDAMKVAQKHCDGAEGSASQNLDRSRALIVNSISGLSENKGRAAAVAGHASLKLPVSLAQDLSTYAIKTQVGPSILLLTAYLLSILEKTESNTASVLVDLDQRVARGHVVGPVLVPFPVTIQRAHTSQGPAHFASFVRDSTDVMLQSLQVPTTTNTSDTSSKPIPVGIPAFSFHESAAGLPELSNIGQQLTQALHLTVRAHLSKDRKATEYELCLDTSPLYTLNDLSGLLHRIHSNLRSIILPSTYLQIKKELPAPTASPYPSVQPLQSQSALSIRRQGLSSQPIPYVLAAFAQFASILLMGTTFVIPVLLVWPAIQLSLDQFGQYSTLALIPLFYHLMGLIICAEVLVMREIFTRGRLPSGEYALNSTEYLRWWFMSRLIAVSSPIYIDHMRGTGLYIGWLRMLGARIGSGCRLLPGVVITDPDLLQLGEDVLVGKGARLLGSVVRDGVLRRQVVTVEDRAHVGTHAVMMPGSKLGRDALLDRLSVAVEDQHLSETCVYEAAPARLRRPRDDIGTAAHQRSSPATSCIETLTFYFHALLAPSLAVLAAALAYAPTAALAESTKLYPFFSWSDWQEGPILLALFSTLGIVPMLAFPTLIASMPALTAKALLLPDAVLRYAARQGGMQNITAQQIRDLLMTSNGVDAVKQALPKGMSLTGQPGDIHGLKFVTAGATAVKEVMLDAFGLPAFTAYGLVGLLWVFAIGFLLQGFILTAMTTVCYHGLFCVTPQPYRVRGFKAHIRGIRTSILRWTYDRFMRLFTGTDLVVWWYRSLGAKMGKGVVLGNIDVFEDPHLIHLGQRVAIVDGATLETVTEPGNGYVVSGKVEVADDGVIAVRSVLAPGTRMGKGAVAMPQSVISGQIAADAVMMGVPARKILDRSSLPGMESSSKQANCCHETFIMSLLSGLCTPILSIALLLLLVLCAAYPSTLFLFYAMADRSAHGLGWPVLMAQIAAPLAVGGFFVSLLFLTVLQKWIFRRRAPEGQLIPLGGPAYHARLLTLVFSSYANTAMLSMLQGSALLPRYLNLLGSKVHHSAYINTLLISDPDLLKVGADAVLDHDAVVMPNALEGRGMVLGPVTIEDKARLGSASLVLRDTTVKRGAEIAETAVLPPTLSLRIKGVRWGAVVLEEAEEEEV